MEYPDIDKDIYKLDEIRHALKPQKWAYIGIAIGILATLLALTGHTSAIWSALAFIGAFSLLTLICFYLFGDSRRPYYKPGKKILERTYDYYPASAENAIKQALSDKDEKALAKIKKSANPDIVLVRYSDKDEKYVYSQIKISHGTKKVPGSEIFFAENTL